MQIIIIIAALALLLCNACYIAAPVLLIGLILNWLVDRADEPKKAKKKSSSSWSECRKRVKMEYEYRETPEGQKKYKAFNDAFDAEVLKGKTERSNIKGYFFIDTMAKRYLHWASDQCFEKPEVKEAYGEFKKAEYHYIKNQSTESES